MDKPHPAQEAFTDSLADAAAMALTLGIPLRDVANALLSTAVAALALKEGDAAVTAFLKEAVAANRGRERRAARRRAAN